MWTHSQKLGKHWNYGRSWLHAGPKRGNGMSRGVVGLEWKFGGFSFGIGGEVTDEHWSFRFRIPLVALYLTLEGFGLWKPQRRVIARWDNDREIWLTDQREFGLSIHSWAIWLDVWSKWGEWSSSAPWWERTLSLHFDDLVLGKQKCTTVDGESWNLLIPMPEGTYAGRATVRTRTWRRARWFPRHRTDVTVAMETGIPFPGKGENSWDCGMDGLWGFGCSSTEPEAVIAKGVEIALADRRKYGGSVDWRPPIAETAPPVGQDDRGGVPGA